MRVTTPIHKPECQHDQKRKQEDESVVSQPRLDQVENDSRDPAMHDPLLPVEREREWISSRKSVVVNNVLAGFQVKPEVRIVERLRRQEKHEGEDVDVEDAFERNISHGLQG